MSRHSQPHPSGGWLSLALAVFAALGGASIASNVAAGPARVAIGWTTVLAAAVFLIQYRSERQMSLRLARIDYARRRDAVRLREELAEAHHRSRLAVERSYAAVVRSQALAAEVSQLMAVIRATPAPSVQFVAVAPPAPVQPVRPAPIVTPVLVPAAPAPKANRAPAAAAANGNGSQTGAYFDLPLVTSRQEAPFASPTAPTPARGPSERVGTRVDLRSVESSRLAKGA